MNLFDEVFQNIVTALPGTQTRKRKSCCHLWQFILHFMMIQLWTWVYTIPQRNNGGRFCIFGDKNQIQEEPFQTHCYPCYWRFKELIQNYGYLPFWFWSCFEKASNGSLRTDRTFPRNTLLKFLKGTRDYNSTKEKFQLRMKLPLITHWMRHP